MSGEIRPVPQIEQRISEAEKLGYDKIFISKQSKISKKTYGIAIEGVNKIENSTKNFF